MSKALEILIGANVVPDENSGAAGTVIETTRALAAAGARVESFWSDSIGRRISHGNLNNLIELPRAYRRVVRERLATRRFDVVQLSQPFAYLAGRMVLQQPDRPLMVWRSHGLEAKVDAAMAIHAPTTAAFPRSALRALMAHGLHRTQREATRWTDGAIVPCADDRQFLIDHFGADPARVRVIWHGVPDAYLDTPTSTEPGRWRRILHVSQMSANKGPMIMHEVAGRVLDANPEVSMTWICPKRMHDEVRAALPQHVLGRVELRDWVDRVELMGLYDSHGIFLFPTLSEGAAKVVMEAMSRGMCVVSSDTSGPTDYIQDGRNGRLVPVGDAGAMVAAANDLLDQRDLCPGIGAEAARTAAAFRWSRCASQMLAYYDDLRALR